ncbi:MAG: ABC transporter ATP-binding protein [Solobacterium sp.]|nr:ABC transporter ATP-binding protein [Solobacterium sp.]
MIEMKHVSFRYEAGKEILDDISFRLEAGESVGLIGANGAGKSTIMKLLSGILFGDGEVLIAKTAVNPKNLYEIRRKLGYVLQDSDDQMFMPTVYEDMIFAPRNYGLSKEETEERIDAVLEKLDLKELKHSRNHKISGGEKRMAAIATILAMDPEVILMDEPTASLDPYNRRLVINAINSLSQTKLITSHDLDMILDTCGRVILLDQGKIIADGKTEEILRDQKLLEAHRMELPLSFTRR